MRSDLIETLFPFFSLIEFSGKPSSVFHSNTEPDNKMKNKFPDKVLGACLGLL